MVTCQQFFDTPAPNIPVIQDLFGKECGLVGQNLHLQKLLEEASWDSFLNPFSFPVHAPNIVNSVSFVQIRGTDAIDDF